MPNIRPPRLSHENVECVTSNEQKCDCRPLPKEKQAEADDEREEINKWSIRPKTMPRSGIDQQEHTEQSFNDKESARNTNQNHVRQLKTRPHVGLTRTS